MQRMKRREKEKREIGGKGRFKHREDSKVENNVKEEEEQIEENTQMDRRRSKEDR